MYFYIFLIYYELLARETQAIIKENVFSEDGPSLTGRKLRKIHGASASLLKLNS